jgi:putative ABC transport system substrate-binding protein
MRRREFIALLGGAAAAPLAARAQQPSRVVRIGFLRYASPHDKQFNAFRDGLRALGYVEGRNILIEQRYARGVLASLAGLAADLVGSNVDIIVVDGSASARTAKAATAAIPVVFSLATDPEAEGLVSSIARPGANLTGLTISVGYQLAGKRVELLKDIKPDLSRLAVLAQPDNLTARPNMQEVEQVAAALDVTVHTFEVRRVDDLPRAFDAMVEWKADGVNTLSDAMLFSQRQPCRKAGARQASI